MFHIERSQAGEALTTALPPGSPLAELDSLEMPRAQVTEYRITRFETLRDLRHSLELFAEAQAIRDVIHRYRAEFGSSIDNTRLLTHHSDVAQPLTLLRRVDTQPTTEDLIRLGPEEFIHWLAQHTIPSPDASHLFIQALQHDAKALEVATIKVATWNIAGLPRWLGAVTSPLTCFTPERYTEIGRRLASSAYDVVALQEMWDAETHRVLVAANFPHGAPHKQTYGLIGRSGLAILSRHPIVEYEERSFRNRPGVEKFVKKGMLRALIELENGTLCNVYTGHFLSPPEPATRAILSDERARDIRTRQFDELAEFIANGNPTLPTVVLGDFNCERGDQDYTHLRSILDIDLAAERWRWSERQRPTFDPHGNHWARGYYDSAAALDHIWVPSQPHHTLVLNTSIGEAEPNFHGKHLSDHYLLSGSVTWLKRCDVSRYQPPKPTAERLAPPTPCLNLNEIRSPSTTRRHSLSPQ